jgi:hypothetical protein
MKRSRLVRVSTVFKASFSKLESLIYHIPSAIYHDYLKAYK